MSDASISTAVQAKLTSDRLSNFPRIDVDRERGVVNLSGVVETEAQRAQASRLAKQVRPLAPNDAFYGAFTTGSVAAFHKAPAILNPRNFP